MNRNYTIETGPNINEHGNRVMPLVKTTVWYGDINDGPRRWLSDSVGWKAEETEAHAIKLADELLAREAKS